MTDVVSRLAAALAERYVIERELGQGGPNGAHMIAAKVQTTPTFQVLSRTALFPIEQYETATPHTNYDVDPSGNQFLVVRHRGSSEIILMQNWAVLLDQEKVRR